MLRYLRVSGVSNEEARVAYHANNPRFITINKIGDSDTASNPWARISAVVGNAIIINIPTLSKSRGLYYEAVVSVSENQPIEETIEELTSFGLSLSVYNVNGVLVCDNGISPDKATSTPSIVAPGEMTSEPIDGTGETI